MRRHLPAIGILISVLLFILAATYYPGGTAESAGSVGYQWSHNFISTLFQARALNGAVNPARYVAIPAWFIFCVSIGILFWNIAGKGNPRWHKKPIEIGGIGATVYAFLVVTPMHNLLINIALLFLMPAVLAILNLVFVARQMRLFCVGMIFLTLLLISGVMYYGNVLYGLLPLAQKLTFAVFIIWLLALHYIEFKAPRQGRLQE